MLAVCNTSVSLQSKVTSSGGTINSCMILFCLSLLLLLFFFCFFYLSLLFLLLACLLMFAFKFVLLSCFWFVFAFVLGVFFLVCSFSFLEGSADFISMWAGTRWSYNHLLVRKLTFLILELYLNLKCGGEVWL